MKKLSKEFLDGMRRAAYIASETEAAAREMEHNMEAEWVSKAVRRIEEEIRKHTKK